MRDGGIEDFCTELYVYCISGGCLLNMAKDSVNEVIIYIYIYISHHGAAFAFIYNHVFVHPTYVAPVFTPNLGLCLPPSRLV